MVGLATITALISKHGLAAVAPIAVLEGPIVTVIAASLAAQNLMSLWGVVLVVIAADLVGDTIFYGFGRWGLGYVPRRLARRLGLTPERLKSLTGLFKTRGGRALLLGKLTHSAGFAVLTAAGVARMPLGRFLWFNLLGTVPKSLAFAALGYGVGTAFARVDNWITKVSLIMGALIVALVAGVLVRRVVRP